MKKRLLCMLLVLLMLVQYVPVTGYAVEGENISVEPVSDGSAIVSGTCGDNLTWELLEGTLTISGTGQMDDFTSYGPWYSQRSSITDVIITDGVTSIGDYAFWYCNKMQTITLGGSLKTIGRHAFDGCVTLKTVEIPDGVTQIGDDAFRDCKGLSSMKIPNSVNEIGYRAFYNCSSLTVVTIPDGVTGIGESMFSGCSSLISVTIPDSVSYISYFAFHNCTKLKTVTIPMGVTCIQVGAFYGCSSLTSVAIPDSVTSIEDDAFYGCSNLTSVTIPNSVARIEDNVFSGCSNLTSVIIPDSVASIGCDAFDCVRYAYFKGDAPITDRSFQSSVLLRYLPNTSGWTDNEAYNAIEGTWNGYMLMEWDGGSMGDEVLGKYTPTMVASMTMNYGEVKSLPTVTIGDLEEGTHYTLEWAVSNSNLTLSADNTKAQAVGTGTSKIGVRITPVSPLTSSDFTATILYCDVTINNEDADPIVYSTDLKTAVTFSEEDFETFWEDNMSSGHLYYVSFDGLPSSRAGDLYTTSSLTTEVSKFDKFYYNASSTRLDLDKVTFVPNEDRTTAYTVEIDFTAYSTTGKSVDGTVVIMVDESCDGDIEYTTYLSTPVVVDEDDFVEFWEENAEGELLYLEFDTVPRSSYGTLCISEDEEIKVSSSDKIKPNHLPSDTDYKDLSKVTFVPSSTRTEAFVVKFNFTAYGVDGQTLQGSVKITVRIEYADENITYETQFEEPFEICETDFVRLWSTYGIGDLSHVVFTELPDPNDGMFYAAENILASKYDKFVPNWSEGSEGKSMAQLRFVPNASREKSYTVTIPFTAYAVEKEIWIKSAVEIHVSGLGDIVYTTDLDTAVTFVSEDFIELFEQNNWGTLSYLCLATVVSIDPLPEAYEGKLYTSSAEKTEVTRGDDFKANYFNGSKYKNLNTITFRPNPERNFGYIVDIPFYAHKEEGGYQEITVAIVVEGRRQEDDQHTVTWVVGGKAYAEVYQYGDMPSCILKTDKAPDENYTYTFIGWDKEIEAVTGDVTYTAQYEATPVVVEDPIHVTDSMQAACVLENELILCLMPEVAGAPTDFDYSSIYDRVGVMVWWDGIAEEAVIENAGEVYFATEHFKDSTGKWRVRVYSDGVPAKHMSRNFSCRSFYIDANGEYVYGKFVAEYSVRKYVSSNLDKVSASEKALYIAMLNYGAAAQAYFNENTADLANSFLTDAQKAYTWDESLVRTDWSIPAAKEGTLTRDKNFVTSRSAAMTLEGAIDYNWLYGITGTVAEATALVWTEAEYNAAEVLTEENATVYELPYDSAQKKYMFTYEGLAAKEMFKPVYVCGKFVDGEGNVHYTGVLAYCPERYGTVHMNDSQLVTPKPLDEALARTLIIYGDAARAHFSK